MATSNATGRIDKLKSYLSEPISGQSLAITRIVFGGIMVWEYLRYIIHTRIERYYVDPDWTFPYYGWEWIQPLPDPYIYLAWDVVGVCALLVALGLFYRVAIVVFTIVFTYFFLLDMIQYLNHFYMVILYAILLCFMPANRMWSLDALIFRKNRSSFIPRWPVSALRLQTEIVLIFAGLVKISSDWLQGQPLFLWLRGKEDEVLYGFLFQYDWAIVAGSWFAVVLHVCGAPLLYWRKTRLAVFLIYCSFHFSNAQLFNIGIFPWLTIALTLIFFEPDWPSRLFGFWKTKAPKFATLPDVSANMARLTSVGLVALTVWFSIQIYMPIRQLAFDGNGAWTDNGHKFSWRMRIFSRSAHGYFLVVDPVSGETWEAEPKDMLVPRSAGKVLARSDLVIRFAHKIEDMMRERGYADVEVYAHIEKSLNGRAYQTFIDPEVDLTEVNINYFGSDPWVVPLTTDLWDTRPGAQRKAWVEGEEGYDG